VTLVVKPIEGPGPERFYVFDGDRRIGRISKGENDVWSWGIDWFAIGRKLLADHRGTPEQGTAAVKAMWEFVTRSGVEILSKGQSPSRAEAIEKLKSAWRYVLAGGQGGSDQ
jgi:hypothetical protein